MAGLLGDALLTSGPTRGRLSLAHAELSRVAAQKFSHAEFFAVIAQVIPVLFLILLVEYRGTPVEWRRSLPPSLYKPGQVSLIALGVAFMLGLGEACALIALSHDAALGSDFLFWGAASGIGIGGMALLLPVLYVFAYRATHRGLPPVQRASFDQCGNELVEGAIRCGMCGQLQGSGEPLPS